MKNIETCVRAIIQSGGRILVCWHKEKQYYFFPGGHMDFGETVELALTRELKEELDIVVKNLSFIGVIENIYKEERDKHREHRGKHHEINLVFNVLVERAKDKSLEDHIDFVFLSKKDFARKKIFPIALKKAVIEWFKSKKTFWTSQK
jgi:ADP-ribose pyrophosphatase YjhB (NUDIX family)